MKRKLKLSRVLLVAAAILLGLVIALPFLWVVSASLQTETGIFRRPPSWLPDPVTIDNYGYVFTGKIPEAYAARGLLRSTVTQEAQYLPIGLQNSLMVATSVVVINLLFGTLAAYTFARERFRGQATAFSFILTSRLLPGMAVAIPTYMIIRQMGLQDSKTALVLIYSAFTLPFTIWVLTLYFRSLPRDYEEAAQVDGCTRFQALRHIVLPLAAPGLAAVGAFSFLFSYDEFLFALLTIGIICCCVLLYASADKGQLTSWLREEALSKDYLRGVYRWLRQQISGTWGVVGAAMPVGSGRAPSAAPRRVSVPMNAASKRRIASRFMSLPPCERRASTLTVLCFGRRVGVSRKEAVVPDVQTWEAAAGLKQITQPVEPDLGYKFKVFKVTTGNCYEIYGQNKVGQRTEVYFHPITGEIVEEHKS